MSGIHCQGPTRRRTEPSATLREAVCRRKEGVAAVETRRFHGSLASPIGTSNEPIRLLDANRSTHVATSTGRDEVGRDIVARVAVDVVWDDGIAASTTANPDQISGTPMTALRPWPNLLVQHDAMKLDASVFGREWMTRHVDVSVATGGHASGPAPSRQLHAAFRAVGDIGSHRPALLAGLEHDAIVPDSPPPKGQD